jgi:hypothetical protein
MTDRSSYAKLFRLAAQTKQHHKAKEEKIILSRFPNHPDTTLLLSPCVAM